MTDRRGGGPRVLHVDLDAFFAAVEQRDKPSLQGRPVVVGGLGNRGVVATASYEARSYGVASAMPTAQARRLCPNAAFLAPRIDAYRRTSATVMEVLARHAPVVEPVSLDEAYLDLSGSPPRQDDARVLLERVRAQVYSATSLTASIGAARNPLLAKIASDLAKPDGALVVAPGTEQALLDPLPVRVIPGVGPATEAALRPLRVSTVADLRAVDPRDLVGLLGEAHGRLVAQLARGQDDRRISSGRERQSISHEDTFEEDIADPLRLAEIVGDLTDAVVSRLQRSGLSARSVTLKARTADFTTLTRSATMRTPTDSPDLVRATATRLLADVPVEGGLRLLGVAVHGLQEWHQGTLFALGADDAPLPAGSTAAGTADGRPAGRLDSLWVPGEDVVHAVHGRGWVWGAGLGRVTVRFEDATTGPGPVHTVPDDEDLQRVRMEDSPTDVGMGRFEG